MIAATFRGVPEDERVLISADTDFGAILARSKPDRPSLLLIRRLAGRRAIEQVAGCAGHARFSYHAVVHPAGVAQMAERPPCKRQVSGSIPLTGSTSRIVR